MPGGLLMWLWCYGGRVEESREVREVRKKEATKIREINPVNETDTYSRPRQEI